MWGYLLMSIVSAMIAIVPSLFDKSEVRHYEQMKNLNSATSADILRVLDKIKTKSQSLSYKQRERIAGALGRTNFNAYISSGLSESLVNELHHKLNEVQDQIQSYKTMGDVESTASEGYANQYHNLTDEQKAKAKIRNDVKITKENHPNNVMEQAREKARKEGKSKSEVDQIGLEAYHEARNALYKWNPASEGGKLQIQAEEHANKAKEYYDKANALGEQYV